MKNAAAHGYEKTNIALANAIALIGAIATALFLIALIYFFGWPYPSNRWYLVATIIAFFTVPFFNKIGWNVASRYLLCYTPIVSSFVVSIVNKTIGPIYINDYYVFRIIMVACAILPILVFSFNQYKHLTFNLLPTFLGLAFFDTIHNIFNVGIFQTGYEDDTYVMTTVVSVVCYLVLASFIYFLKRNNEIYFRELSGKNQTLNDKNKELQDLKEEVESNSEVIIKQNEELKGFSAKLQEKVDHRTKELTSLNQELADQNIKLEQYTFITAHNLKSPVVQIKGLLNILSYEKELSENTQLMLDKIESSCGDLEEVITDLNKILNIKNGHHSVQKFNLSEVIDKVINSLRTEIKQTKITIERDYPYTLEMTSVQPLVFSIFFNVIHNAIKYYDKEKDQPHIKIFVKEGSNSVEANITDNGVGFDLNLAKGKVFQLYQRFNTTVQGRGLGLFLVKTQLDMIEGDIEVKSEVGEGTSFNISLPKNIKQFDLKVKSNSFVSKVDE